MTFDPRLYLVTGDVPVGSSLEDVLVAALEGGITALQLRDKSSDASAVRRKSRRLAALVRPYGVPLIVNDDLDAASMADGAHVGLDDARPERVRRELGESAVIGWSINDLGQFDDAKAISACDYVAASPVWATPSKPDTSLPWGLEGVREARRRTPPGIPVVAIGGIGLTNAAEVIDAGADGIAVISAICQARDPRAAAAELRDLVDSALARRKGN